MTETSATNIGKLTVTKGYNFGPWEIWNGGEWEGDPDELVQVQLACESRGDVENSRVGSADDCDWRWDQYCSDWENNIICFRRVVKPTDTND